jgi:hypothetical protein
MSFAQETSFGLGSEDGYCGGKRGVYHSYKDMMWRFRKYVATDKFPALNLLPSDFRVVLHCPNQTFFVDNKQHSPSNFSESNGNFESRQNIFLPKLEIVTSRIQSNITLM